MLINRWLAFRPGLKALMNPVILPRHGVDVALQMLVHAGGVKGHIVARKILPRRGDFGHIARGC